MLSESFGESPEDFCESEINFAFLLFDVDAEPVDDEVSRRFLDESVFEFRVAAAFPPVEEISCLLTDFSVAFFEVGFEADFDFGTVEAGVSFSDVELLDEEVEARRWSVSDEDEDELELSDSARDFRDRCFDEFFL